MKIVPDAPGTPAQPAQAVEPVSLDVVRRFAGEVQSLMRSFLPMIEVAGKPHHVEQAKRTLARIEQVRRAIQIQDFRPIDECPECGEQTDTDADIIYAHCVTDIAGDTHVAQLYHLRCIVAHELRALRSTNAGEALEDTIKQVEQSMARLVAEDGRWRKLEVDDDLPMRTDDEADLDMDDFDGEPDDDGDGDY